MTHRSLIAAFVLALAACASTPQMQMPPDIAAKVKAIGPVIDPPKTAAICPRLVYLPGHSHMSEVYAVNTEDRSLSGPVLEFAR